MEREKVVSEIAKSKRAIKRKYRALKIADDMSSKLFSKTFKPLISPLENIQKVMNKEPKKEVEEEVKKQEWERSYLDDIDVDDDEKKTEEEEEEGDNWEEPMEFSNENKTLNRSTFDQSLRDEMPVASRYGPLGRSYLKFMLTNNYDTSYGPHVDGEKLQMGGHEMILRSNDDIMIGDQTFEGSEGLYNLLFEKTPKTYTESDMEKYKNILQLTKRHLKSDGNIKSNSGFKYLNVIQKMFPPKKGKGLMTLNNKPVEYVYYDDLNELVDRLEILVREQNSGHTGHNNEIQSILEELREVGVIRE